jgi:pilus assembly protein Flp/PilA
MRGFIRRAVGQLDKLLGEETGVTAIEYGLIAGAIAVAIIAVLLILGQDVANMFSTVSGALQQAGGS